MTGPTQDLIPGSRTNESAFNRDGDRGETAAELISVDQDTGEPFARYAIAGRSEALAAVARAREVAGTWWELGFESRAERLRAW